MVTKYHRYTTHMIRILLLMDIVMMRAVVTTINIIGYLKKKNTTQTVYRYNMAFYQIKHQPALILFIHEYDL